MNDRQITIRLQTRTALHIGAGYGDAVTDAIVRRDALGRPIIPGTGLAGALRALATRLAPRLGASTAHRACKALSAKNDGQPCGCVVCKLFGDINPGEPKPDRRSQGGETASAARIWVFDAALEGAPAVQVRDGVGIDRAARAAYRQGGVKFDLEVLPAGTKFLLRLEIEAPRPGTDVDSEERLLAAVLAEWKAGRAAIGGRASRGLGTVAIVPKSEVEFHRFDFSKKEDLLAYLRSDDPLERAPLDRGWLGRRLGEIEVRAVEDAGVASGWVRLTAQVKATGTFLVNSPVTSAESGFDHAPLGGGAAPILPGSSLKGALRSQAERIARTLATAAAKNASEFLLTCPVCSPVVSRIDPQTPEPQESCDSLLRAKQVVENTAEAKDEHLCLACRLFGCARRGSRLRVEDAALLDGKVKPQDFLAIDRFTGGGADEFKFDAAVLWQPHFEVRLFLENPEPWELGWLLLALRDAQEGLVPLGFGASKGMGQVEVRSWEAEFGYLNAKDAEAMGLPATSEREPGSVYRVTKAAADQESWKAAAQRWVEDFAAKVKEFRRRSAAGPGSLPALELDTYFRIGAEKHYPEEEAHHE